MRSTLTYHANMLRCLCVYVKNKNAALLGLNLEVVEVILLKLFIEKKTFFSFRCSGCYRFLDSVGIQHVVHFALLPKTSFHQQP